MLAIKANPAAVAVRADLGLPSLQTRRRALKLGYWSKLCEAQSAKLLSVVFRSRHADVLHGRGRLSCLHSFRDTLCKFGLATLWRYRTTTADWAAVTRRVIELAHANESSAAIGTHSSLALYARLDHDIRSGTHPYLDDRTNLHGTRLKSALRMGTLWTMSRVASALGWPAVAGQCLLCGCGIEDSLHFLITCTALQSQRDQLLTVIDSTMIRAGPPGVALAEAFRQALCVDNN